MRVAITGASGHIGNVLMHDLLEQGYEVTALQHNHNILHDHLPLRIVTGDVLDRASVDQLMAGADAVIHTAAVISISGDKDGRMRRVNVDGVGLMLEAALHHRVKKFVQVSSIHAFQQRPSDKVLNESRTLTSAQSPAYDQSKRDGQLLALAFAEKGLNVTVVNPTSVVGPPDIRPSLMGKAIIDLCNGKVPALIPGGFDFVDVRDVVKGITGALQKGRRGECYLLSGKWHSIVEITGMLGEISGRSIHPPLIPAWLARTGLPFMKVASFLSGKPPLYTSESIDALSEGNRQIDAAKAKTELGFMPRPLFVTLQDLYKWFIDHDCIKK
ncbi:MAG: NAD-dependent epimerase/dehydratase family protein [Chitinophagales bacterium]|nr:NAD-dependent epimerase/dehydratase family protein [Chitinophagales bacterium]